MSTDNFMKNDEVIDYINTKLGGYRGYVQFSDRPLEQKDVFEESDPTVSTGEEGFVYEAHFSNASESISIKQLNAMWYVSKTSLDDIVDFDYYALEKTSYLKELNSNWIKMAQVWESSQDELCDGMDVLKLKKVVFAGFESKRGDTL